MGGSRPKEIIKGESEGSSPDHAGMVKKRNIRGYFPRYLFFFRWSERSKTAVK
jgi:hypothetical protein